MAVLPKTSFRTIIIVVRRRPAACLGWAIMREVNYVILGRSVFRDSDNCRDIRLCGDSRDGRMDCKAAVRGIPDPVCTVAGFRAQKDGAITAHGAIKFRGGRVLRTRFSPPPPTTSSSGQPASSAAAILRRPLYFCRELQAARRFSLDPSFSRYSFSATALLNSGSFAEKRSVTGRFPASRIMRSTASLFASNSSK